MSAAVGMSAVGVGGRWGRLWRGVAPIRSGACVAFCAALGLSLAGCADPGGGWTEAEAARAFARASLDLRGVRPSVEELEAVRAAPEGVAERAASLASDARFGGRVASFYAPIWQTRAEASDVARVDYAMPDESAYLRSVGEEPLQILARIAGEDLPWTEIVTADWTVVDEVLAAEWPVDYPAGETGWRVSRYTDGRPHAGVLSSTGLWWRYMTTYNNANRGRVNNLSRILLCTSYSDRPVAFNPEVDLTDEARMLDAIRTDPSCIACHGTMDPAGAYLWGFYSEFSNSVVDWAWYHPDRERFYEDFGVAPAWFGQPGAGLEDLGRQIADDPRLISCAVERAWGVMGGGEADGAGATGAAGADLDRLTGWREGFIASGLRLRALFADIAADPAYLSGRGKVLSPDQYASAVEDLTGWRFVSEGRDVFGEDLFGMRTLAGGSRAVGVVPLAPTATMAAVQERVAQAAAAYAVAAASGGAAGIDAAAERAERGLFLADPGMLQDEAQRRAGIARLYLRALSVEATEEELSAGLTLWQALYAIARAEGLSDEGPQGASAAAWAGLLSGILREPRFYVY